MKIGILLDEIAPGSAPKLLGWSIKGLEQLGHKCEGLVMVDNGKMAQFPQVYDYHLKGIKIRYLINSFPGVFRRLDFRVPGFSFLSLHHFTSWLFAHHTVDNGEFDIIVAHCQYSTLAARNLLKHRNVPFLLLMWDPSTYTLRKIYRQRFGPLYPLIHVMAATLDRIAYSKARAIITSGKLHHERIKKVTDRPLEVLFPGCFSLEELPPFEQREKMILTYDRWDIGNVPNLFLDLLERLNDKEVRLTIGGFWHPATLKDDFEGEVKKRGLSDRVKLLGPLNEQMIMDLCSRAMVHIHPIEEAFGMQTLEAAACGCPIIIPAGSGVTDLFQHGVHGYFPEKQNFEQLIHYTNLIFADPAKSAEMGRAAWEVARANTWVQHAAQLERILKKYVG